MFEDGKTDRYQRWQVVLEILSFYVFILVVYFPLWILLATPAFFSLMIGMFQNATSQKIDEHNEVGKSTFMFVVL